MPTYDYLCKSCGHALEIFHKITEEPRTACPNCQGNHLQRKTGGGIGLSFKGTGFYITDYNASPKKESSEK